VAYAVNLYYEIFSQNKVKYLNFYQISPPFSRSATISLSKKIVTALGLFFMREENNNLKRKEKKCYF
jgi:hypothetical protein